VAQNAFTPTAAGAGDQLLQPGDDLVGRRRPVGAVAIAGMADVVDALQDHHPADAGDGQRVAIEAGQRAGAIHGARRVVQQPVAADPGIDHADGRLARYWTSRSARRSGQRRFASMPEWVPSVIESPKATSVPPEAATSMPDRMKRMVEGRAAGRVAAAVASPWLER
jgi:hypothetical protein